MRDILHYFQSSNSWFKWQALLFSSYSFCFNLSVCEPCSQSVDLKTAPKLWQIILFGVSGVVYLKCWEMAFTAYLLQRQKILIVIWGNQEKANTAKAAAAVSDFPVHPLQWIPGTHLEFWYSLQFPCGFFFVFSSQDPFDHLWLVENMKAPSCVQDQ